MTATSETMTRVEATSGGPIRKSERRTGWLRLHPAWVPIVAACAVFIHSAMASGLNTDAYWQLAAGQWMLAHHAVIRHDVFTYTVLGHKWVAEEWGFEVLLAWTVAHLGPVSWWVVAAGPCCIALLISVFRWRRMGAQPLWSAAIAVVAAAGILLGVAPRPQVFSYAFLALELFMLQAARRDRRWLIGLPVLMLFWANIHGSFIAGLGVLVLELLLASQSLRALLSRLPVVARFARLRCSRPLTTKDAALTLLGATAASFVNPHGPALELYAFRVATTSKLNFITEWQSPDFHTPLIFAALAIPTILAVIIFASSRRPIEVFDLLLWIIFLILSLRSLRFIPYVGIVLGGLLAPYQVIRRETLRPRLISPILCAALCTIILAGSHPPAGAPTTKGALAQPVEAAAWLVGKHGRVLSTYANNDYLIHVGIPVFVDGRTDMFFGTGILTDYRELSSLNIPPDPLLAHFHIQWVLWPKNQPLSLYLSIDPRWRLVKTFGSELIFERK